ncbi:MAG: hypothetical protein A3D28_06020 [Omnitrophica bacterium RIFCSPHIGHO2_02_FULL_63_14]|nr:MAG: hypothetical protein A3D28_06020 [Omnitrophica bacterium RIFCSPHIGHO2_02_FULL_63_14]
MWKLLILNAGMFVALFLTHFHARRPFRLVLAGAVALAFVWAGCRWPADPFAWFSYAVFAALTFRGGGHLRRWATARSEALDAEIATATARCNAGQKTLAEEVLRTESVRRRASEISHLYEKTKEMSRSLEIPATFLLLGEALERDFNFRTLKLALFNGPDADPEKPDDVFELRRSDFEGTDKPRLRTQSYPADAAIFRTVFESKRLVETLRFVAYPALIDGQVFAVLVLSDVPAQEMPTLSILTGRFLSEIQRVRLYERIQALAITDGLTGVYVRRHLLERFQTELDRARRHGFKLSFLMIDIDRFKDFNDRYGHLVGDVVLRQVAATIKRSVREFDLVGRYGGEEFGVLLIETDESSAFLVADRIRRHVAQREFKAYDEDLRVTISIGVASYSDRIHSADLLVDAADSALYQAKRQGRNKVCLFNLTDLK